MATRQIDACVLHGAKDLRLEKPLIPPPAAGELQIAVQATGLCGSDLHYYSHGRNGDIIMQEPMCLGHESAGTVAAVGPAVYGFEPGDRVALEVGLPCEECLNCSRGNVARTNESPGLPDDVSLEMGALLEPLSVAIHATRRAQVSLQSSVAVFGAGAVGLLAAAAAKAAGAGKVVIADTDSGRVDFAVRNRFAHAGYTVPVRSANSLEENLSIAKDVAGEVGRLCDQDTAQVETVFECTGVPSCAQAAIYAARAGGRVILVGMGNPAYALPVSAATSREVDLLGVFRYANTYKTAIGIVSSKDNSLPDLSKLITHRYSGLQCAQKAFQTATRTRDDKGALILKVMVDVPNTVPRAKL
ncbi:MAG: hypothetical protein M1831_001460 [Alyxoria varia]|nr:MAG: hypothetical protein M1831_001460 [Alyxoria varia]